MCGLIKRRWWLGVLILVVLTVVVLFLQQIVVIANVDAILLVDSSTTVYEDSAQREAEMKVVKTFVKYVADNSATASSNRIAVLTFGSSVTPNLHLSSPNVQALDERVRFEDMRTRMYAKPLQAAYEELERSAAFRTGRKLILLVITTGEPNPDAERRQDIKAAIEKLADKGVGVYLMGLGEFVTEEGWAKAGIGGNQYVPVRERPTEEQMRAMVGATQVNLKAVLPQLPLFWSFVGAGSLGLLLALWVVGSHFIGIGSEWRFMRAIRKRQYPSARATLDTVYRQGKELQSGSWLYEAERYVVDSEVRDYMAKMEQADLNMANQVFLYREQVKEHLETAAYYRAIGTFTKLRGECAFVLDYIAYDNFPQELESKVPKPFVKSFDGAIGIEPEVNRLAMIARRTPLTKRKRICLDMNRQARLEEEKVIHPIYEVSIETLKTVSEASNEQEAWKQLATNWALGEETINTATRIALARALVEAAQSESEILAEVLALVNSESPRNRQEARRFYATVFHILWQASVEAQERDLPLGRDLCREWFYLVEAVALEDAGRASLAVSRIFDTLGKHNQGRDFRYGEDVYGLCYFLASLDSARALSGDGRIYFYEEAKDYLRQSSRYSGLLDILNPLEGKQLTSVTGSGDFVTTVRDVQEMLYASAQIPSFERTMVAVLLQRLEEVARKGAQ